MRKYEPKYEDYLGKKFHKLEVIALLARDFDEDGHVKKVEGKDYPELIRYLCRCECGKLTVTARNSLRDGTVHSCGCAKCGRPKGRRNYELARAFPTLGCDIKNPPCEKMRRTCCWDCDDYEGCEMACTNNPAKCGRYKG